MSEYAGSLSDEDLKVLSEMLLIDDTNNVGGKIQLNLQCTTNNGNPQDCSPAPLFTHVDPSVLSMPVYVKLAALYDNYAVSPSVEEDHTEEEQMEEMALIEVRSSKYLTKNNKSNPRKWPAQP